VLGSRFGAISRGSCTNQRISRFSQHCYFVFMLATTIHGGRPRQLPTRATQSCRLVLIPKSASPTQTDRWLGRLQFSDFSAAGCSSAAALALPRRTPQVTAERQLTFPNTQITSRHYRYIVILSIPISLLAVATKIIF
jgi:hypothetical protein